MIQPRPWLLVAFDGDAKYILGPVDIEGTHLKNASAGMDTTATGQPTGQYAVSLELDSEGTKQFAEASQRLYEFADTDATRNRFAVVLDGTVIVAPSMNVPISDGRASITGNFTASEAQELANQLQFGSLPLNFEVQSEQQISATLGVDHLQKGIWAGLVGLLLVVGYMAWQVPWSGAAFCWVTRRCRRPHLSNHHDIVVDHGLSPLTSRCCGLDYCSRHHC
jgi:preprotein translocase subunit SecD